MRIYQILGVIQEKWMCTWKTNHGILVNNLCNTEVGEELLGALWCSTQMLPNKVSGKSTVAVACYCRKHTHIKTDNCLGLNVLNCEWP